MLVAALPFLKFIKLPKFSPKITLILILLLGALLRLGWLGFSSHTPKTSYAQGSIYEGDIINIHAVDITRGVWFYNSENLPSARRPIGYPVVLGVFYKLFGVSTAVAYGLHLALHLATILLLYLIGKRLFGEGPGLLAAFLFSIYPISIYSIKLITDENLFLSIWYAGLYLLIRDISGRRIPFAPLWYGIIFGYAAMTRTHVIFMPLVVALAYLLVKRSWRKIITAFIITALAMQLVNLPWILRNYHVWKTFVPYTLNGRGIYSAVNSTSTPEGGQVPERGQPGYSEELEAAVKSENILSVHRISNHLMTRWIIEHPVDFLDLGSKRLVVFLGWQRLGVWPIWFQYYDNHFDPTRPISQKFKDSLEEYAYIFYYILFFAFFFSLVLVFRKRKSLTPEMRNGIIVVGACFLLYCAEQMIIYPDRKYRYPLEPLMILFASYWIVYWAESFRWREMKIISWVNRKFLKKII